MFAYSSRTDSPICSKLGMLIPWDQKDILGRPNSGNVTWVRVLERSVPVARKLSTIEERRKDQNCLFRRGNYRNEDQNPENLSCIRVPVKTVLCSSETKHDRRTAQKPKLFVSAGKLQERRSQTRKLSWVRVLVKILGLGMIFPYDIQRYVSND
jgi:hypothetical protein